MISVEIFLSSFPSNSFSHFLASVGLITFSSRPFFPSVSETRHCFPIVLVIILHVQNICLTINFPVVLSSSWAKESTYALTMHSPPWILWLFIIHPKSFSFFILKSYFFFYPFRLFYEIISFQMNLCFIRCGGELSFLALEFLLCFEISVVRLTLRRMRRILPSLFLSLCVLIFLM